MMKLAGRFLAIVWLAVAAGAGVSAAGAAPSVRVIDLDNHQVDPFQVPPTTKAIVFLFTSVQCPVSNRYAPVVQRLSQEYAPKGVQFWLVYPNPSDTAADIRTHQRAFSYSMPALRDPDHTLANFTNVTITPEAALYDRQGREMYHGRIDDTYVSLGLQRPAPTRHDLADAIGSTLAGKPVGETTAQAVGCFIADFIP